MSVRKADVLFVLVAIAIVIGIALLPSPIDNNPMIPADKTHHAVKDQKECLVCHSAEGTTYPLPDRHPKRPDCVSCHGRQ